MTIKPSLSAILVGLLAPGLAAQLDSVDLGELEKAPTLPFGVRQVELHGQETSEYPWFEFTNSSFVGRLLRIGIDPSATPIPVGAEVRVYILEHRTQEEWATDTSLVDVRGVPSVITLAAGGTEQNRFIIDTGTIPGDAGTDLGVGYDIVIDLDRNASLSPGDLIDGFGERPGFWMLADTVLDGPYAVTEEVYNVTGPPAGFRNQNTFFPSNIADLGELPLVVISHGNGHNYQWYDHLGEHLASWGFVVMSHQNNTVPGIETASTTTLQHTDAILGQLATIEGGVLDGHVDGDNIIWIGHSRGGEGIARAYDRLFDGQFVPANYTIDDIKFLSSIAPTDFLGPNQTNPHGVPYHLWTGSADNDVNGCANCDLCQTYHLHDRATGSRLSSTLHGAGHAAFHNGTGGLVATGPCLIGRGPTHRIMKGYLLGYIHHFLYGNEATRELMWRQFERYNPPSVVTGTCVVLDLTLRDDSAAYDSLVVDDFQTNSATNLSSSGAAVNFTVAAVTEGRLDDGNSVFTHNVNDEMNGMTGGGPGDSTRGLVFEWDTDGQFLEFELPSDEQDLRDDVYLSFRACQATRHPFTTAVQRDLHFDVTLRDISGNTSTINIRAYGGGIEEPYQRSSCGSGSGWANSFETVRMRLADFLRDGTVLNLGRIEAIRFTFGSSHGADVGRLGFDDLEITKS